MNEHEWEEWALMGHTAETLLVGRGPFQKQSVCPAGASAFYKNSYDLSDPTPWLIPEEVLEIRIEDFLARFPSPPPKEFTWEAPDSKVFSKVFQELSAELATGDLKKSVPVVTEQSPISEEAFKALLPALFPVHENLTPYGYFSKGEGFLGASPEFLFQSFEGKLKTMALAGTARAEEKDLFSFDEKEIREHEFVAETLLKSLTPLGMTRRHERSILSLGALIHFHTSIDVELYQSHPLDDLIHHLHPTPALGPLPRTEKNLQKLYHIRDTLQCPSCFGAPFGVYHEGRFRLLVAIRMITYKEGHAIIPSGCGVIQASSLTNEWRELSLKRESVKKLFRLL